MKLTDNEKREILKLIEAGKPLPDKYRFMLFDDKREVELVWNGKTSIIRLGFALLKSTYTTMRINLIFVGRYLPHCIMNMR